MKTLCMPVGAILNYKLTVRALTSADACMGLLPSLEDNECLEMYLSSLATDIQNLNGVRSVTRNEFIFLIEVDECFTQSDLKLAMKPFFAEERFWAYRFVSLER